MSTRATYRFKSGDDRFAFHTTVYIHTDGYPSGAATYFYNTLLNPSKGCFATEFIRANEGAEITGDKDHHVDTEYHYELEGSGPEAAIKAYSWERNWGGNHEEDSLEQIFDGHLHEFITQESQSMFCESCCGQKFSPFKHVDLGYRGIILNQPMAAMRLEGPIKCLAAWKGRFNGSANWKACVDSISKLLEAFPDLRTGEIDALCDPLFVS